MMVLGMEWSGALGQHVLKFEDAVEWSGGGR